MTRLNVSEGGPYIGYGDVERGHAVFSRRCACGRIVHADAQVIVNGAGQPQTPNATCNKCGRVAMPFVGWE